MSDRVEVRHGPLSEMLTDDERFALVIADPPWVSRAEVGRFPEDPVLAIDGGPDGLDVARECMHVVRRHLAPGGSALLQLGTVAQVEALAEEGALGRGLVVTEVREHERGVLVRLDRPWE